MNLEEREIIKAQANEYYQVIKNGGVAHVALHEFSAVCALLESREDVQNWACSKSGETITVRAI